MPKSPPQIIVLILTTLGALPVTAGAEQPDPSVVVGAPKVFDHRSLELMVQDLDAQLRAITAVDASRVAAATGNLQGRQARSREREISASTLPLPKVELVEEADDEGELGGSKRTTTQEAVTPTPPSLPEPGSLQAAELQYGLSARDLLAEQVDLSYQIYNLRMLLNRSVSDRYKPGSGARLQAVLGFQVSLDPRREHRKQAAVVEVEVAHKDRGKRPPSLVALMPLENTYNAAAISRKSSSFGGAAIVQVLSVGFTERRRGETFYLYQDSDTFAFERPPVEESKALRFGWQFRPVLDQPSVRPGVRQLFVVLALDARDANPEDLKVTARTHWLPYDRKHRLARKPHFGKVQVNTGYENMEVSVPDTASLQNDLGPTVTKVEVTAFTGDSALVDIEGERFFSGVQAQIGDVRYTTREGNLVRRSHRRLQLFVPARALPSSQAIVSGREYGLGVPVIDPRGPAGSGIRFAGAERGGTLKQGEVDIEVWIDNPADPTHLPELHGREVWVELGNQTYQIAASTWRSKPHPSLTGAGQVAFQARFGIPFAELQPNMPISIAIPFFGKSYRTEGAIYSPVGIDRVVVLQGTADPVTWGLIGYGFSTEMLDDIVVYAGRRFDKDNGLGLESHQLLTLSAPAADLAKAKSLTVVLPGHLEPVSIPAPATQRPVPVPSVQGKAPVVAAHSAATVEFTGEHLNTLTKVRFGTADLPFQASMDKLVVALNREVTKAPGTVSLLGYLDETKFINLSIEVR